MQTSLPLDARLYRTVLHLFPPAFQDAFADDMLQDFVDARAEAGPRGRARFYARTAADLVRTVPVQWWRTGWPVIIGLAATITVSTGSAVAAVWPRDPFPVAPGTVDREGILLGLLTLVVLFLIASTILITVWTNQLLRRRRRT